MKITSFEQYFETGTPQQQELFQAIRKFLNEQFPELKEEIKYGGPFYTYKGIIAYLVIYAQQKEPGVYIGLAHGAILSDKEEVLVGVGNTVKKMYFDSLEDCNQENFGRLGGFIAQSMMINDIKKSKGL